MNTKALSQHYLDEIQKRCKATTPGPWTAQDENDPCAIGGELFFLRRNGEPGAEPKLSFATHSDFEFIAHARQDIPLLLDEIDRLREMLRKQNHP